VEVPVVLGRKPHERDPRIPCLVSRAERQGRWSWWPPTRWAALVGLRVKRVDLLHGRVTATEQVAEVNGQLIPGPPKTEAGRRTVTLPATAAAALAGHLAEFAEPGPDGLVFPAPEVGDLRRSNLRRRWWLHATRVVGVEGLWFHDLPYSATTLARRAKSRVPCRRAGRGG
jgi:integrase